MDVAQASVRAVWKSGATRGRAVGVGVGVVAATLWVAISVAEIIKLIPSRDWTGIGACPEAAVISAIVAASGRARGMY